MLDSSSVRVRALSIKQPWASMIARGEKTVEVRSWRTPYRGRLLIVASRRPAMGPAGCALAVADLVDCRPMVPSDEGAACGPVAPHSFAWILREVRPINPFPVRGRLGLYFVNVPAAVLRV